MGLAGADDETDIEGPFRAFTQISLRALNGRIIAPDLVLLTRSGHIVVVEVKLADNPELRDRQVVAQLLELETAFDFILLDLMLPRKDRLSVSCELRRSGMKTPIILFTARAQETEQSSSVRVRLRRSPEMGFVVTGGAR